MREKHKALNAASWILTSIQKAITLSWFKAIEVHIPHSPIFNWHPQRKYKLQNHNTGPQDSCVFRLLCHEAQQAVAPRRAGLTDQHRKNHFKEVVWEQDCSID